MKPVTYKDIGILKGIKRYEDKLNPKEETIQQDCIIFRNHKIIFQETEILNNQVKIYLPIPFTQQIDFENDTSHFLKTEMQLDRFCNNLFTYQNLPIDIFLSSYRQTFQTGLIEIEKALFERNVINKNLSQSLQKDTITNSDGEVSYFTYREISHAGNHFHLFFFSAMQEFLLIGHMRSDNNVSQQWEALFMQMLTTVSFNA